MGTEQGFCEWILLDKGYHVTPRSLLFSTLKERFWKEYEAILELGEKLKKEAIWI